MCGRINEVPDPLWKEYLQVMRIEAWDFLEPSFNLPPSKPVGCFRHTEGVRRNAFTAEWGFRTQHKEHEPNARADTVLKYYPTAFRHRRCIFVCGGFFEWDEKHSIPGVTIQPYYFSLRGGVPMTFAGLWDDQWGPTRCVIITTEPNDLLRTIHHRMPVLLAKHQWDEWLDDDMKVEELTKMLVASDPLEMQSWPVTKRINTTRGKKYITGPECVAPADLGPQQGSLF